MCELEGSCKGSQRRIPQLFIELGFHISISFVVLDHTRINHDMVHIRLGKLGSNIYMLNILVLQVTVPLNM